MKMMLGCCWRKRELLSCLHYHIRHIKLACMTLHTQPPVRQKSAVSSFVPVHTLPGSREVSLLQEFLTSARRVLVLTGAGLSTESGIPDYRSHGVGLYARASHRPVQYHEFVGSEERRRRYWARNFVGWPAFSAAQPNDAHYALATWQDAGRVTHIVTQNVDALHSKALHSKALHSKALHSKALHSKALHSKALHSKAGSSSIIELHGCSHRVRCLSCDDVVARSDLQDTFSRLNPAWRISDVPLAPDGDVMLPDDQVAGFQVPPCTSCGGVLMPDVVFFGANVPRVKVELVYDLVTSCDALLVAGSSLQVYSGYRFVVHASQHRVPVAIVNIGPTRADQLADLKIDSPCGALLPQVDIRRQS